MSLLRNKDQQYSGTIWLLRNRSRNGGTASSLLRDTRTANLARVQQGRIQPVRLGGRVILVIFGSQDSLGVHYCKRDEVYFTTLL